MPLTSKEVEDLYRDTETDRVERKSSYANSDVVREAICSFANDLPNHRLPGVIFIGQHDDLRCANIDVNDDLLLKLGGIRSEGKILPLPVMTVQRHLIDGCELAVIVVDPSDRPPVRFNGRTCVRVGPRKAVATVEEERRLTERQHWQNLPFDSRPFSGASLTDLDDRRFNEEYITAAFSRAVIAEDGRSLEEKLRGLRLISPDNTPTAASLLLLGKEPRSFFPGAYVQFVRINGRELTDEITDQKEISGTIPDQINQIDTLIKLNIKTSARIGSSQRVEKSDYPVAAIEQLIRNALLHRNYDGSHTPVKLYWFDDRIEIHSPGGLYGEVTPETIWRGATAYRNPLVAEGMKALGFVERFGFGLKKAASSLRENGNPEIKTDFVETFVAFIIEAQA